MNYGKIKKLDEDTLKQVKEGPGPSDQCICNLLAPPEDEPKGIRGSIKKAFKSLGGQRAAKGSVRGRTVPGRAGQKTIEIPLTFSKGGKGLHSTKEEVKRKNSCGKCGCDNEKFVLKHSVANIRIITPDVSSICPCPTTDCMPDKEKFNNNIQVTVEQLTALNVDPEDSYFSYYEEEEDQESISEPEMERRPISELLEVMWLDKKRSGEETTFEDDVQSTSSRRPNPEPEDQIKNI